MVRVNIVATDIDTLYLKKFSNYIIDKRDNISVHSFTSDKKLIAYLSNNSNKADVIVISEEFENDYFRNLSTLTVVLCEDVLCHENRNNLYRINKYQKMDKIIDEILKELSIRNQLKNSPIVNAVNTKIVSLYSPTGGSGKTVISVALSALCANMGMKVLYLNFEKISSAPSFLDIKDSSSLSDVFLALRTKNVNVGLKIENCKQQDEQSKIYYLNPVRNFTEFNKITTIEAERLINEIKLMSEFDIVFIDMTSDFSEVAISILRASNTIIVPFVHDAISLCKIKTFLNELSTNDSFASIYEKLYLVANKSNFNTNNILEGSNISQHKQIYGNIPASQLFLNIKKLLASDTNKLNIPESVLQIIT